MPTSILASATTARDKGTNPLRRRLHILERANSFSSLNSAISFDSKDNRQEAMEPKEGGSGTAHSSPATDYESRSETETSDELEGSEGEEQHQHTPPPHVRYTSPNSPPRPHVEIPERRASDPKSPMSPGSRAWYEFDLAVVVALVSPIGNWLTGGDHVKNLLLVVLLIFYLHQIIEVPWTLYQKSRPRRRAPFTSQPDSDEGRYKKAAASELRFLELFFLFLTATSPYIGAVLLRHITAAIIGPDAVSWFSTGLFVLATGMRPWSHIVERLSQRATDLHDVIHYPAHDISVTNDLKDQLADMTKRMAQMEKTISKSRNRMEVATEEVYDYVDEVADVLERAVKRHDKKHEKHEVRVKDVEDTLEALKKRSKERALSSLTVDTNPPRKSSLLEHILPDWLLVPPHKNLYTSVYSPSTPSSKITFRSFPSSPSPRLATIPEEGASLFAQPTTITSGLIYRIGYVATMPLRAAVRMVLRSY